MKASPAMAGPSAAAAAGLPALLLVLAAAAAPAAAASPVGKAVAMLGELQGKVLKQGEVAQKQFAEFSEWCEDRNRNLDFEIKTGKSQAAELQAAIDQETSKAAALTSKVEDLAKSIAANEKDLEAATKVRETELADFKAEEKELMDTIEVLERAIGVLEKEMKKGGASMLQLQNAGSLVQAMQVMVQASLVGTSDAAKLTALVQESQRSTDEDEEAAPGAPEAAVYESKSGGIVDVLQDLLEKAETQLDEARKKETTNVHNFEMLKQSLEDELKFATKDVDEAKKGIAESGEMKSSAEGDLQATSKELAADEEAKGTLHHDCMTEAENFELEVKSRGEELAALAEAKKVLQEVEGTTELSQVASFVQVARLQATSGTELPHYNVVRLLRELANKQRSASLAQLASRMLSTLRMRGSGDPFSKVKGLITDMIAKLEEEATAEADKKAYCDKELAETETKKTDKTDDIEKLTTKIDQMSAKSAKLKEETMALQSELSKLSKSQAQMDKMRHEEKDTYEATKAEQETGLAGIQRALSILRDYYGKTDAAHGAATGGAAGIIGLLETVESDITKNLAELASDEEAAAAEYEKESKENELEKTAKEKDVAYKAREAKSLDKSSAELVSDRSGEQDQLDAIEEYFAKIKDECTAKAEPYEERKARREAELAGLKEGLRVLESEVALVQRGASRRVLRGSGAAALLPSPAAQ